MRNKGKITLIITIGIACFVLAMIIFMQFKVVRETDITSIDTMREEDLKAELASWKTKYEEVEQRYNEVTEKLKKYNEESSSDAEAKKHLEEELNELNLILGLTDTQGSGLIMNIKDTEETEKLKNDELAPLDVASELMIIVNTLKEAGAEAISINDQRIVGTSDFVKINSFIKINGKRITSPYTIKVIGEPDYLKSSIIASGYEAKIRDEYKQEISFEEKKKLTIQKYDGDLTTRYIKE